MVDNLVDPSLLEGLTDDQRKEALAAAAAAQRAEQRAEQRAIERAMQKKQEERLREKQLEQQKAKNATNNSGSTKHAIIDTSNNRSDKNPSIVFVPKNKRAGKNQLQQEQPSSSAQSNKQKQQPKQQQQQQSQQHHTKSFGFSSTSKSQSISWTDKELQAVKETYLGKSSALAQTNKSSAKGGGNSNQRQSKPSRSSKKITFRFEWDNTDDTLDDTDPLYAPLSAQGNRRNRQSNGHGNSNNARHQQHSRHHRGNSHQYQQQGRHSSSSRGRGGGELSKKKKRKRGLLLDDDDDDYHYGRGAGGSRSSSFSSYLFRKPIEQMTTRDWRIFRENYEIVVRGGRAPPPLRTFRERPTSDLPTLHPSLLKAIEDVMHYKEPTPIQRQAIPIGLQRRDLIGIAETGSGKTCAFGVPLMQYILQLSKNIQSRVADDGPLALVVAPTRELALQIHGEFQKLLSCVGNITDPATGVTRPKIKACAVVGGQPIQQQAQQLREGVHIVVGTPGRMNDCIEMAYLVLNQCCYIVLDEADRMIDMGFAPQMESILDSMGGLLKSENEQEAYKQEQTDLESLLRAATTSEEGGSLPKHRLTAMFSATMPLEIERMAKRYLRHPAVISIGDQDSGKNARIVQRVVFLSSPSQKENALRDLLRRSRVGPDQKIIVFVNEKKHADGVGRIVERIGRSCVVLHGGKSQDQREENLAAFRSGNVVLVATDVAGRGLDIPDVAHVINYDLPTRSIDTYSHRIGRTGRAGKEGLATSFLTDEDTGIMAPLKSYLESTGNAVPDRLARHPAASTSVQGNVIY